MRIYLSVRITLAVSVCVGPAVLLSTTACGPKASFNPSAYPHTPTVNQINVMHGRWVEDPYRWLEDENADQVKSWVRRQNDLTKKTLAPLESNKKRIARELEKVYGVDAVSNLYPYGDRYFYSKRAGLENHSSIYVRHGSPDANEHLVLDPNTFSHDGTVSLDWWYPSPDGSLVAYGKSTHGSEKSTLYIRNVITGEDLADVIPFTQYCKIAWNADGTGFYYNRSPDPTTVPEGEENFHMKVYFHKVGTDYTNDTYLFGEGRPYDEEPKPYASSDHEYVLLNFFRDPSRDDLFIAKADGRSAFVPVADGLPAITHGDVVDDALYLLTNYNAPRYRIATVDVVNPGVDNWRELIPEMPQGVIEGMKIINRQLVLHVTEDVRSRVMIYELNGAFVREIPLPGMGTVSSFAGTLDRSDLFFSFSSWVVPTTVYHYDLETEKMSVLHERECPYNLRKYETRQVWATSSDGTEVPMFIVSKKEVDLDGENPTLLYGYGGFNSSFYPRYRPRIIPFLKRGGVWALANIRGGGEFGQAWHDGGRRGNKQKSFNDFYAAAEKLIELGYTKPEKLACKGGSNGGLLIGAAITQRPDLFAAALSQVPLMDMLRFNLWGMGAQWVHEYGDPNTAEEFEWLISYSPYHNVKKEVAYPATLIVTAEADNRVDTAHAFKMTARMQALTASSRPVLLRCETKAGHGAGKPLNMWIENLSEDWAFLMWQLGMIE